MSKKKHSLNSVFTSLFPIPLVAWAYLAIIVIWSTTPLTIKWSSIGVDYITGVSLRMFIGAFFVCLLSLSIYKKIPLDRASIRVYLASSLGIYGAMMLVYWGAQAINSGLVSVIYGLSPIITSLIAITLFKREKFTLNRLIGALLGFIGLFIIFFDRPLLESSIVDTNFSYSFLFSVIAVLVSVITHAYSAVWIQALPHKLTALQITTGGLLFSFPLFLMTTLIFAQPLSLQLFIDLPMRTLLSIIYLGLIGSVLGFVSYYYVLSKLSASTVSLSLLITPLCALMIGKVFNQEHISNYIALGTLLILSGLFIHQFKLLKEPRNDN